VPSPKEVSPVKEKKPPGEDTAKMEDKSKQISEDDYKAKLAEKRRQAREKAERDAEEAKQREEQRMWETHLLPYTDWLRCGRKPS